MLVYFLVALGLSMDAFAVSVSSGICVANLKFRHGLRAAFAFGLFQFLMPLAGYAVGSAFSSLIRGFDHWIAAILLALIGGKMLLESRDIEDEGTCTEEELAKKNILNLGSLLVLAVATSIDALAVGVSYSVLGDPILTASLVIGVVTFGVCLFGVEFGKRLGTKFERWAELAGGVILVAIGGKILVEHLVKGV